MAYASTAPAAPRWTAPAALALLFAGLTAWSWRKWADVHIDFGAELYIAWQLSEGRSLYTDIAYRHGPFSHYANALLFAAFGVSVRTLVVANLAVLVGICAMWWRLFARACDRFTAAAAVAVMLCGFGFGQHAGIANFNYVTPYLHAQTHGLALSLLMLVALDRAAASGGRAALVAAGASLGAVFLTKTELFLPALGTAAAALAARAAGVWGEPGRARKDAAAFAAGWLAPVAGFAALLIAQMPADTALRGLLGNFAHLGGTLSDPFYRRVTGLDDPVGNAVAVALAVAAIAAAAAAAAIADRAAGARLRSPSARALLGLLIGAGLAAAGSRLAWLDPARALPVVGAVAAVGLGAGVLRRGMPPERRRRLLPLFLLAVYATLLLAKLGLAARFSHYGFVLAAPATLLLVAAGTRALPAALRARGGGGDVARWVAVGIAAVACALALADAQRFYADKRLPVGSGADAILAPMSPTNQRGARIAATLDFLADRMQADDTLVVLPEGAAINYWLRKRNPTPFTLFVPTEIRTFGETAMLAALAARPPDYVVLAHRLSLEFGVGPFGRDPRNGLALRRWIDARYREVARFGPEPFTGRGFGTLVLERRSR